ncbi:Uncharacterized protein BP5553_09222 [Venustampulla echinocandica]|uniref:Carboxylesterase type B domain-containing protein n=1 Tax=Venustampulla echinocandica TaxID=2656787 RepID=A0A370TC36_9HELO|nr:Uncharacterized protein BP5553_09222 [Venustampulla echinocandica]RDL31820.1 Uncharacterized protein BP5553_09222 [Venustampulla echinocandica]
MQREVPGLGTVNGIEFAECPNVEQYRGIPYGSVPARFRQSKLVTSWPDNKWDGTVHGPLSPYPRFVIGFSIVQKSLPAQHDYYMDEFKCLNLNITCPKGDPPTNGWPVTRGNIVGSGSEPGYNMAPFVNYSVEQNLPVVAVTINYRLGIFGFLASEAIRQDNEAAGDKGVGNYGLRDQLLAFEWVKKNINAFGGDPAGITAMGESAGSIDTHLNISSELFPSRLPFNQAILQSGVAPLTVRGMKHHQDLFDKIASHFQLDLALPLDDQISRLRELPTEDLIKSYIATGSPMPSWQAAVDGYYLKTLPKFSQLLSQTYHRSLKRLLIGDCDAEGILWVDKLKQLAWTYEKLQALSSSILGEERTTELLQAYELSADAAPERLIPGLIRLLTDAEWSQPIEAVAHSFANGDVFYYHFKEGNPFPGPKQDVAHHAVDLLYPFLTYNDHLPDNLKTLAKTMAKQWLAFINGGQPWKPYDQKLSGAATVMVFGNGGRATEALESEKPGYETLRLVERLQGGISDLAAKIRGEDIILD